MAKFVFRMTEVFFFDYNNNFKARVISSKSPIQIFSTVAEYNIKIRIINWSVIKKTDTDSIFSFFNM